ncbi:MAG: hypothetical protein U1F66_07005 [bacterium]
MTPPSPIVTSETQNLGNSTMGAGTPYSPTPGQTPYQPMPRKQGGCCGCGCFSGCLAVILLIVGLGVGFWYFVIHDARYVQHSDTLIVWTYRNVVRPKIIESFSAGKTEAERQHFLQMTDGAVDKYVSLPPEEKQAILGEAATALWYLWTQQVLPPEKIPHLTQFGESLKQEWEKEIPLQMPKGMPLTPSYPTPSQEAPRPTLPQPKPTPRLLN